jgi:hypothetical protein
MGQNTTITFYSTRESKQPNELLRAIVGISMPRRVLIVYRTLAEDRGWDDFLQGGPGYIPSEHLPDPKDPMELALLYKEGVSLGAEFMDSHLARRVSAGIGSNIPISVRNEFLDTDLIVRIGFHDLFEDSEHEDGLLIARAFLSIEFFGYSTPSNWQLFREAVFRVPEIQAVQQELEAVTGPLEQCVIYSV